MLGQAKRTKKRHELTLNGVLLIFGYVFWTIPVSPNPGLRPSGCCAKKNLAKKLRIFSTVFRFSPITPELYVFRKKLSIQCLKCIKFSVKWYLSRFPKLNSYRDMALRISEFFLKNEKIMFSSCFNRKIPAKWLS